MRISMRQIDGINATDVSLFIEHKIKFAFRSLDILLDVIYVALVFRHGEYTLASFSVAFFGTTCLVYIYLKGWNLMTEYIEFRKFENTMKFTMEEFKFEEGKEEDCGICMEKMRTARKLRCGHCFHQFCLMQMILNKKTTCPICRQDLYNGNNNGQQRENQRNNIPPHIRHEDIIHDQPRIPAQNIDNNRRLAPNVLGNLMNNMFRPFAFGGSGAVPMIQEQDIARVQEVYPNMTREQVVQEILRTGGVEQAILAIAERL